MRGHVKKQFLSILRKESVFFTGPPRSFMRRVIELADRGDLQVRAHHRDNRASGA